MTATTYTTPARREGVAPRARRGRWLLVAIGLVVVLIASVALTSRPTDFRDLSIDNSTDTGARAVAQILGDQGVSVRQYDTLASIYVPDPANTTLVIAGADQLAQPQADSIVGYQGDIVFIGASAELFVALDAGLDVAYSFLPESVSAECADPDAAAAEESRLEWAGIVDIDDTDAELCFGGRGDAYAMAVIDTPDGKRTIIANSDTFMNGHLESLGHAALTLH